MGSISACVTISASNHTLQRTIHYREYASKGKHAAHEAQAVPHRRSGASRDAQARHHRDHRERCI
eukprot:1147155-Pelagomonas_calceolata.AAC.10